MKTNTKTVGNRILIPSLKQKEPCLSRGSIFGILIAVKITKALLKRYHCEGPRYTSYPTAPVWSTSYTADQHHDTLAAIHKTRAEHALYIHIPFCEKRCLYCACNVVIRKSKPKVGDDYCAYLEKEMALTAGTHRPLIKHVHLGGGTPTFLSDAQLDRLMKSLAKYFDLSCCVEFSIEVDPRTVNEVRIRRLSTLFNRISFGVQDLSDHVQKLVKREHSFLHLQSLFRSAREAGFLSINADLIYGLPRQGIEGFSGTISQVIQLKPDRLALYSFAYVPWVQSHQRLLQDEAMPSADEKIALFLHARNQFLEHGYKAIAMDHFALPSDELAEAFETGRLRRNFMGYSTLSTPFYFGLGVSAISYLNHCFSQNTKTISQYYEQLDHSQLPIEKGYALSKEDQMVSWVISKLMSQFECRKDAFNSIFSDDFDDVFKEKIPFLKRCEEEGLLHIENSGLVVSQLGRFFVRNICMGLDDYLKNSPTQQFSKTI